MGKLEETIEQAKGSPKVMLHVVVATTALSMVAILSALDYLDDRDWVGVGVSSVASVGLLLLMGKAQDLLLRLCRPPVPAEPETEAELAVKRLRVSRYLVRVFSSARSGADDELNQAPLSDLADKVIELATRPVDWEKEMSDAKE
jgi:hypothetical protein